MSASVHDQHLAPQADGTPIDLFEAAAVRMQRRIRGQAPLLISNRRNCEDFLDRILGALNAGLCAMGEALAAQEIVVDAGLVRFRTTDDQEVPEAGSLARFANRAFNHAALPDMLRAADSATQYSQAFLGKCKRSPQELADLYAALLVHGTNIDTSAIAQMFPAASIEGVPRAIRLIASRSRLREANEKVAHYVLLHGESAGWTAPAAPGSETLAASWRLWKAAHDPRHQRHALEAYGGLMRRYGVPQDVPIAHERGSLWPAIDALVTQQYGASMAAAAAKAVRHGKTSEIGAAKLLGIDVLTPVAGSAKRRLWVPRGTKVPLLLGGAAFPGVRLAAIRKGWDELAAFVDIVLQGKGRPSEHRHLISASPVSYVAQRELGRLLRTIHLCAYFTNAPFRTELQRFFAGRQALQAVRQAIYFGPSGKPKTADTLPHSSREALTLLTNIVLASTVATMANSRQSEAIDPASSAGASETPVTYVARRDGHR